MKNIVLNGGIITAAANAGSPELLFMIGCAILIKEICWGAALIILAAKKR